MNIVKKSSINYREELIATKVAANIHNKLISNNESIQKEREKQIEEEKRLLDKLKEFDNQIKQAGILIEEGTNRLENVLKINTLSKVNAAKLLIVRGREQLTTIIEQQRLATGDLDKRRLKRKDAFLHEQSNSKKLKTIQQG